MTEKNHEFQLEFDLASGRLISSFGNHDPASPSDLSLISRVHSSIAAGLLKPNQTLTESIERLVTNGEIAQAVSELRNAYESGTLAWRPDRNLLDSVNKIPVGNLEQTDAYLVHSCSFSIAQVLRRFDIASEMANIILTNYPNLLSEGEKADLKITIGVNALERGQIETAVSIWNSLLVNSDSLPAATRAWAWRNISVALPPDDPQAKLAAQHSADAFLESGDKWEAARSLHQLAKCLMYSDSSSGIDQLEKMLLHIDKNGLVSNDLLAAALHARGIQYERLGMHAEALRDAKEAIEIRKELFDQEADLVSSLHLAAIAAKELELEEEKQKFECEADMLGKKLEYPRFRFTQKLEAIVKKFDRSMAEALLQEAEFADDLELVAAIRVVQATMDEDLLISERLHILESTLVGLEGDKVRHDVKENVQMAIADVLYKSGEFKRASTWLKKLLDKNPLHYWSVPRLIDCLWKTNDWNVAAIFLKKHLGIVGDKPGLLTAYGRSRLEAGDVHAALGPIARAMSLSSDGTDIRKAATDLHLRITQRLGGGLPVTSLKHDANEFVGKSEFAKSLSDFSKNISESFRMSFWVSGPKGHRWIPKPERRAQDLLLTWLKAEFKDRIALFQEISVGAGRLDIDLPP